MSRTLLIETPDVLSAHALALDLAPRPLEVLPGAAATWKIRIETDEPEVLDVIAIWLEYSGFSFANVLIDGVSEHVAAASLAA